MLFFRANIGSTGRDATIDKALMALAHEAVCSLALIGRTNFHRLPTR